MIDETQPPEAIAYCLGGVAGAALKFSLVSSNRFNVDVSATCTLPAYDGAGN